MSTIPAAFLQPIKSEGAKIDRWARRRYGISGPTLLAKLGMGESGFKKGQVSYAGAREEFQFIPSTRAAILRETGADAYGSPAEKVRAARIYVRRGGLEGYNPGDPSYPGYILGQKVGHIGKIRASGAGSAAGARSVPNLSAGGGIGGLPMPDSGGGQGVAALLSALQAGSRPQISTSVPAAPMSGRSRYLHMPATPQAAPAPDLGPSLSDLLALVPGQGSEETGMPTLGAPAPRQQGAGRQPKQPTIKSRSDLVRGNPIDRAGVSTKPGVIKFVEQIASVYGKPITLGTGTKHNQFVVGTHNESDHWTGNAIDLPATGKALTRMGQSALIAAGMSPSKAHKQTGGVFNVNGVQILFNTRVGGNHYNHLHVGLHG